MQNTEMPNITPFKLSERIWFVGGREVSVHIIDTGDGLIMVDTGYPHMRERIIENMRAVGLDPEDLRLLLITHGHWDHTGSADEYRRRYGAKIAMSRIDSDIARGTLDLSWTSEHGRDPLPPFEPDILIDDGDVLNLGDVSIRCLLAPGHTAGTLALFFDIPQPDGSHLIAGMHGGVGLNSMSREFLERKGLSLDCRDHFREGLQRLSHEHVDIVLGNHPGQTDTEGKLARMLAGKPDAFYDPTEWPRFLKGREALLDEMLAKEANE